MNIYKTQLIKSSKDKVLSKCIYMPFLELYIWKIKYIVSNYGYILIIKRLTPASTL